MISCCYCSIWSKNIYISYILFKIFFVYIYVAMKNSKIKKIRIKLDKLDEKMLNIIKKRNLLVDKILSITWCAINPAPPVISILFDIKFLTLFCTSVPNPQLLSMVTTPINFWLLNYLPRFLVAQQQDLCLQ